jgi:hypothetical protein
MIKDIIARIDNVQSGQNDRIRQKSNFQQKPQNGGSLEK